MSSPIQSGSSPISDKVPVSESGAGIASHSHNRDDAPIPNEDLSRGQSALEDLPRPPVKPTDEKIVRNIEVLCQFIAKNGPGFEEMARQKESGNPDFKFLFGGEPGSEASCAHEYYLWMKKKHGLVSSSFEGQRHVTLSQRHDGADNSMQPNSLTIIGAAHSLADSDVDMEDDITQSEKEPVVDPVEHQNPQSIWTGDSLEKQKRESSPQYSGDSTDLNLGQPTKSLAVAETKTARSSGQAARLDSPFRLIQSYASDDSSEEDAKPSGEERKTVEGSLSHKAGAMSSLENMDSKDHLISQAGIGESAEVCPENVLTKDLENSEAVQSGFQESMTTASFLGKFEVSDRSGKAEGSSPADSFQEKKANENHGVIEKEDKDHVSSALRVDEFGRLVKEGGSDSESDDAYHTRRRGKRDRSHSRSPSDRRKRRSPRRRKDRRSRSRSWSPRRRRSRSRSPYRTGGDFGGEKPRRDKLKSRQCFDFLKGRCYRGASCHYMHHELDRSDSSRRYKNKEDHLEGISSSRNPDFRGGTVTSRLRLENNEVKGEKMDSHLEKHDEKSKEESVDDDMEPNVPQHDVEALSDVQESQHDTEGQAQVHGASKEAVSHLPTGEEPPTSSMPSMNELAIDHSRDEASPQAHHRPDDPPNADSSTRSDFPAVQTSAISHCKLPYPGKVSNDTTALSNSTLDFSHQTLHLPAPSLPFQPASSSQTSSLLPIDNKLMAPSVSLLPQSSPVESLPPYQGALASLPNQQSHYPVPPNPPWSIPLPPQPRPHYTSDLSKPGAPLSFQPIQTYQMHAQFPSQGPVPFTSFASGSMPPPPMPFPGDSTVKNMQPFHGGNPLPVEPLKPTFQNQTFPQQIPLPYGPQLTAVDSMSSYRGGSLPVPGYSSDLLGRDHSTRFLDIGGSRISAHYNPYASTFDKPLTSRFSSTAFAQEREVATGSKYDSSSAVGNAPGEGQNIGGHGPRAGGQSLPRSAGDQYDPLFDSMEPSSESFKKNSRKQGHAADNSDILKLSGRYKVLDVEENNKQKEAGAVAAATSLENDEFGETADAEVGAVENGSSSNPNDDDDDDAIVAEGEIEIDQVKSEGKSKKNKDSRSMKLFKIAVANFVKEVLKPQWRQGNMSKEVFKTIVKKTVEKVSGAMRNRRMPKSQAKIDHYIDSQRRKLTQLVEGYVSKYKI